MSQELIKWSKKNYSNLPWRIKRSLYNTLVSEIMLQQTTVGTVVNHFDRFIDKYPDIESLSKISEEEVCIAWKGLGYYRRARNLRKAAISIVEDFQGEIPLDYEKLKTIPGIGEYTASALMSIGADKRGLAVDANLERVLSRVYGISVEKGPKLQKELKRLFDEGKLFNDIGNLSWRELNESLMDLGRIYCQANKVHCSSCPLSKNCAVVNDDPLIYPKKVKKDQKKENIELHLLRVIVKKGNSVLVYKKSDKEWLSGQKEFPTYILKTKDTKLSQYPLWESQFNLSLGPLKKFKTSITKYKITNYILEIPEKKWKKDFSFGERRLFFARLNGKEENFSTSSTKALLIL